MKVFKISPSGHKDATSWYVPADETWKNAFYAIEESLEYQLNDPDNEWDDVKVTIECKTITGEEWKEILAESND